MHSASLVLTVFPPPNQAEDWKAVNEDLQKSCRYVIKNQTTGDRLKIRVVAVNAGGRSPPVALPEAVLVKEVAGKFGKDNKRETFQHRT